MRKLEKDIKKNGFEYRLHSRTLKKAIYGQYYVDILIGFEVFKILERGAYYSPILERNVPTSERFPSNEDFGYTAWSYRSLDRAIEKYNQL